MVVLGIFVNPLSFGAGQSQASILSHSVGYRSVTGRKFLVVVVVGNVRTGCV